MRLLQIGLILALLSVTSGNAWAGDITTGYSFSSGEQNITHTKLNNSVNNAVIGPTFFTGKAATTTLDGGDLILIYDATTGTLMKISGLNAMVNNLGIITNQTEDVTPATGDWVLTYDISAGTLKKATLQSLTWTNDALINGRTNWPTPNRTTTYLLAFDSSTGEYSKLSRSNLFYQFYQFVTFTNLTTTTTPGSNDTLQIFDAIAGANKQVGFLSLLTNTPVLINPTNAATISLVETGVLKQASLSNIVYHLILNGGQVVTTNQTFTTTNVTLATVTAAGTVINAAHALGATPKTVRGVLVNTTSEHGYQIGDEVEFSHIYSPISPNPVIAAGNETNVVAVVAGDPSTSWQVRRRSDGAMQNITDTSWSMRIYARK